MVALTGQITIYWGSSRSCKACVLSDADTAIRHVDTLRCLRFNQFCWVRKKKKKKNVIMKPTNSSTQRQPNPRKIRLKVGIWATFLFPTANNFSWVGIDFMWETNYKKPNPSKFSANTVFTGDHSNQDPRYTQKPIYYTIFAKHIWS